MDPKVAIKEFLDQYPECLEIFKQYNDSMIEDQSIEEFCFSNNFLVWEEIVSTHRERY